MACLGKHVVCVASLIAMFLCSGCRLHVAETIGGRDISRDAYSQVKVGQANRTSILEKLGPPTAIRYTLHEEILEYNRLHSKASDFQLVIPTAGIPFISQLDVGRDFVNQTAGLKEDGIDNPTWGLSAARVIFNLSLIAVPQSIGSTDALSLLDRDKAQDRFRFVLDRESLVLDRKSFQGAGN